MAKVTIDSNHGVDGNPCWHGDFVITEGDVYIIAPYNPDGKLCLVSLSSGCTRNRNVNVAGLTPSEMALEHGLTDYAYVRSCVASINFRAEP